MIESYSLIFIFSPERDKVLLRKKNHGPANVDGKLNGIGGRIMPGEDPRAAAARELAEETGLACELMPVVIFDYDNSGCARLHVYVGEVRFQHFNAAQYVDVDSEENVCRGVDEMQRLVDRKEAVDDLGWLVPMAIARLRGGSFQPRSGG